MATYIALIKMNLRLSFRDKGVIFFNYLFPLVFFFMFAQLMKAEQSKMIVQVVNMVLTIGILGSGLWGQGMRSVQDREQNILRRFKVAPITPVPILVSSIVVGLIHFLPVLFVVLALAHFGYGMQVPAHMISLVMFVAIGLVAFRGVGLIAASVVNSMQESQVLIQILYMPMMFLSGATIPIVLMPKWVQAIAQFLPATHLFSGMQSILLGGETLAKNLTPAFALLTTAVLGTFIGAKLFRWEKEEKLKASSKLWVVGVLAPFVALGAYQAYSNDNVTRMKALDRALDRSGTILIKNARIFTGDGSIVESGGLLVREGKIAEIYSGNVPDAKQLHAAEIEAAGKTVLPGFIDLGVDLTSPGGTFEKPADYKPAEFVERALAAYLYSGVTAVGGRPGTDTADAVARAVALEKSGQRLGAEFLVYRLAKAGTISLAAAEAADAWREGKPDPLARSLVEQVGPPSLLKGTRASLKPHPGFAEITLAQAIGELKKGLQSGSLPDMSTRSGGPLVFQGPALHREMQLWVQAGVPASDVLRVATAGNALALGARDRIGMLKKGYEATLIVVDGNPLQDISATERISTLIFKGERVRRSDLFDQK